MTSITGLDGLFIVQWNNTAGRADILYPFCANFLKLENGKRIHVGWLGGWFYTIGYRGGEPSTLGGRHPFNVPFFANDMAPGEKKVFQTVTFLFLRIINQNPKMTPHCLMNKLPKISNNSNHNSNASQSKQRRLCNM